MVELSSLPLLLASAAGISLVAIGDTIATSTGFAARRGYQVNSNQELAGIGSANLLAGLFQGFPVSTSGSRTALAVACALGVALAGVLPGIVIAVFLGILQFVLRAWRPYSAVLGKPAGVAG